MATIFEVCEQGLINGQSLSEIVNAKDHNCYEKCSLLHIVIIYKQYEILRELLRNQGDVNIEDKDCMTPLHYAVNYKYFDVIDDLLSYNVDLNKAGYCGRTLLHEASHDGKIKIVQDLLNRGADYTFCDAKGRSSKDFAVISLKYLETSGHQTKRINHYEESLDIKQPDDF